MQCKLRNLKTGAVVARNFQGSETVEPADVGYRRVQYLYKDDTGYGFMDLNDYNQFSLSEEVIGDAGKYLVEGGEVDALMFDDKPIAIELKSTVELKVAETSPGVRGDTATGGNSQRSSKAGCR